ncbi:MAG: hypothetical protein GY952_08345 [Rhodobacteraceae bacterium]|nr:hypothetical protein [Paracoccaceae bacterium]
MRLGQITLMLASAIGAAATAEAGAKIPLSAAMAQCQKTSDSYTETIRGQSATNPEQEIVDRRYRACVFAKSGAYPPSKKKKKGVSISGSASIGLVYEN